MKYAHICTVQSCRELQSCCCVNTEKEKVDHSMQEKSLIKEIFSSLTKPLRILFPIAFSTVGLSLFGVIGFIGWYVSSPEVVNNSAQDWKTVFAILFAVLIVGMLFLTFLSLYALVKQRVEVNAISDAANRISECAYSVIEKSATFLSSVPEEDKINELTSKIQIAAKKLDVSLRNNRVASFILQSEEIAKLERSAKAGTSIIVLTSKFKLDSGSFIDIILANIRKGVTYKYLVPKDVRMDNDFDLVCKAWWSKFWEEIVEAKRIYGSQTSSAKLNKAFGEISNSYLQLLGSNKSLNDVKADAKSYFCKHVHKYIVNGEHTLVTIIMYQQKTGPSSTPWEVIMKLSTEIDDNQYYAYLIPEEEKVEKDHLVTQITGFCSKEAEVALQLDD